MSERFYVDNAAVFDSERAVGDRNIALCIDIATAEKIAAYFNWLEKDK